MTTDITLLSPKTEIGATLISVGVHAVLVIGVVAGVKFGSSSKVQDLTYIDLGYEVLEAPPAPVEEVQKLKRSAAPMQPVQQKTVQDDSPRELQDQSSDIAGTEKVSSAEHTSADANGTAAPPPFYKVKPKYPRAALAAGIEGWVLLKIDITPSGEVENIRVVDGEPRELFQNEARRALALWKYRPYLNDKGEPIKRLNAQVMVDFKLEENL